MRIATETMMASDLDTAAPSSFSNIGDHCESPDYSSEEESDSESDDESDSCLSSSGDDETLLAMLIKERQNPFSQTISQPTSGGMKRSTSLPSFTESEMSSMQVNVLLNQVRLSDAAKGAIRRNSLNTTPKKVEHIQGEAMALEDPPTLKVQETQDPTVVFNEILSAAGYSPRVIPYNEIERFFQGITTDRLSSYSMDIIGAVKTNDLNFLRMSHFDHKRNMNCCNRFGESIVHTACRHSQLDVVRFLVKEAKVDLRVVDDFGRTPCHDAAWQADPNMALIELIVTKWPDFLLISDKRGFTPLQYVRKAQWPQWVEMLEKNRAKILPKKLLKPGKDVTVVSVIT
jgi:Ankyrin repeats (3 copies)